MTLIRNFSRVAAAAMIAVGITVGLALPAQAATGVSHLNIFKKDSKTYEVRVSAHFGMGQAQGNDYLARGARIELRIYGDDPSYDNLRMGPYKGTGDPWTEPSGVHLNSSVIVNSGVLNEDSGWYEGAGDEIYVTAKFIAGDGRLIAESKTNVVEGKY